MSITPKWAETYSPSEATRASWIPLDMSTITNYPSSGRGKMAQLNYIVGYDGGVPGVSASNPMYVSVTNPVTLSGVISADLIEIENVNIHSTVSSIPIQPSLVQYKSQTITAINSAVIVFTPVVNNLEVYNNDPTLTIYMNYGSTTFGVLTSQGLPLQGLSYYSIDRDVSTITLGNPNISSVDVRVFGHYRS